MERANDVTRSFLDLHLLPGLPVAWQRHNPQVSGQPFQISVFPKPRGQFMATCRAQTSLQLPLALPDSSSHCLLGFLLFSILKYTIAEMKATSKLQPPHPSAEKPLQGVRGRFLSVNCPNADITSSKLMFHNIISLVLRAKG